MIVSGIADPPVEWRRCDVESIGRSQGEHHNVTRIVVSQSIERIALLGVDQLCPLRPSRINVKCCRKSNGGSTGLPNDVAQMRSRCHVTLPAKKASPRSNASISLHLSNRGLDTIGSCFALPPPPLNPKCLPRTMRP